MKKNRSSFSRLLSVSSLGIGLSLGVPILAQAATPTAAYSFDEGSGSTLTDRSGGSYHGTLRNGPVWAPGKYGGALSFDGSNDYVHFGDVNATDALTAFTVSTWVKFATAGGGGRETHLVDKSHCSGYANGGPWELGVSLTNSHKAEFLVYPQNGSPSAYVFSGASTTSVDDGNWHYVTGRYDGTHLSIWVDGVQENATRLTGVRMPNTTYAMELGGNCNGYAYPFRGSLDDVRIYNRALTQAEIQADMVTALGGGTSPPPPPPPTPDTTAPTAPGGVTVTGVSSSQVSLSWQASSDNVGVAGYRVFRNGTQVGTTSNRTYTDSGLAANTSYSYTVYAYDAAGNNSTSSSAVQATTSSAPSGSYSTNFNQDENPLSEGGRWRRANNNWTNVRVIGGVAYGSNGVTGGYDDSYALLSGFGPNQTGEAVVYRNPNISAGDPHEVEILLRFSDDGNNARGYECLFNLLGGVDIIRWNGPQGNFTNLHLSAAGYLGRNLRSGDVVRCSISGNTITARINGNLMAQATDSTFSSGQPGIGFFVRPGASSLLLGLTSFTATMQ